MHNFLSNFDKIYEVLKLISNEDLLLYQRRKPRLSDLALVAINLTAEYLGFDSECDLFRKLPPGYKLHAVCSVKGVFKSFDISPASVHDINYLKDIQHQIKDCTLIGDRGYLSAQYELDLFEKANIKLDHNYVINL